MYRTSFLLCLIGLVHVLSIQPSFEGQVNYAALQAKLNANHATWDAEGILAYDQTIGASCFCGPDSQQSYVLTVNNGEVTSVTPDNDFGRNLPTVKGLFDRIQRAIDAKAVVINVSYDQKLGYPTNLYIDTSSMIADEEIGYTVAVVVTGNNPPPTPRPRPGPRPGHYPRPPYGPRHYPRPRYHRRP